MKTRLERSSRVFPPNLTVEGSRHSGQGRGIDRLSIFHGLGGRGDRGGDAGPSLGLGTGRG